MISEVIKKQHSRVSLSDIELTSAHRILSAFFFPCEIFSAFYHIARQSFDLALICCRWSLPPLFYQRKVNPLWPAIWPLNIYRFGFACSCRSWWLLLHYLETFPSPCCRCRLFFKVSRLWLQWHKTFPPLSSWEGSWHIVLYACHRHPSIHNREYRGLIKCKPGESWHIGELWMTWWVGSHYVPWDVDPSLVNKGVQLIKREIIFVQSFGVWRIIDCSE